MPEVEGEFQEVSQFVSGKELPEGEPVKFTVRENDEGKAWGTRDSDGQYAREIIMPDGKIRTVEHYLCLTDELGQDKEWTRSSKSFFKDLKDANPQEGDLISITRVGKDKEARYSLRVIERAKDKPKAKEKE